jgi:hypothetical protein
MRPRRRATHPVATTAMPKPSAEAGEPLRFVQEGPVQ